MNTETLFRMAVDAAKSYRDHLFTDLPPERVPYVRVDRSNGEPLYFPECAADVFLAETLTITRLRDFQIVREFEAGAWVNGIVYDRDGHVLYAHTTEGI